jgi:thiosulfate reductase cytochrome b subunit
MKKVYMYARFERLWHWLQAILVITLILTGFDVHGNWNIFGFENAVTIHNFCGWSLFYLYLAAFLWHVTTKNWRQYIPTTDHLMDQIRYYMIGIFKGEPHPVEKTPENKMNPLQRLTYLGLVLVLLPAQIVTGFLYMYYGNPNAFLGTTETLWSPAIIHTAIAFLVLSFIIGHVYMTTTGHTIFANIKAMITGWEEEPDEH